MRTNQTEIEDYKITRRDFNNNVITRKMFDLKNCGYEDIMKMSDQQISSMFESKTIKVFTDIIYITNAQGEDTHNMIVKVWQKISFKCSLPENIKSTKIKGLIKS